MYINKKDKKKKVKILGWMMGHINLSPALISNPF